MSTDVTNARQVWAALCLLALLPYVNALGAGWTFDDLPTVRDNPAVTQGVDPVGALTASSFGVSYRPLTLLSYAANYQLAPGAPAVFHAVNVALHVAVTLLVFALAMRLFRSLRLATIAAALFAVHPIHTEAVTSIVGRAELLAALFGLLALVSAARAEDATSAAPRRALQGASLLAFALAVLSKESAVMGLPLIVLLRIAVRGEPLGRGLRRECRSADWIPYALVAGLFVVLRTSVIGEVTASKVSAVDNMLAFVPWSLRVRSALGVLWDYFGLLNVPVALAADYAHAQVPIVRSWLEPRCLAAVALFIAVVGVAVRTRNPAVLFAALLPFVSLAATANIVFPGLTAKAERLLYFPSIGWALLVAYGCEHLLRSARYRTMAVGMLAIVVTLFGMRTWLRNRDWYDNRALYASMARSAPESARAHYNFGVALLGSGAHDAARAHLQRALAICPWWDLPALAIGVTDEAAGDRAAAAAWYRRALATTPSLGAAHAHLCSLLVISGEFEDAASACRRGLRYNAAAPGLLKGLGFSLVGLHRFDDADAVLRRALALDGRDADLRTYLARAPGASRTGEVFQQ